MEQRSQQTDSKQARPSPSFSFINKQAIKDRKAKQKSVSAPAKDANKAERNQSIAKGKEADSKPLAREVAASVSSEALGSYKKFGSQIRTDLRLALKRSIKQKGTSATTLIQIIEEILVYWFESGGDKKASREIEDKLHPSERKYVRISVDMRTSLVDKLEATSFDREQAERSDYRIKDLFEQAILWWLQNHDAGADDGDRDALAREPVDDAAGAV